MFKSYVYLEVRVLLSAVPGVFIAESTDGGPKDILSAKKEFLRKNNSPVSFSAVHVQPSVLHKVSSFVRATGGRMLDEAALERLTGKLPEPPDDRTFTGLSVLVAEGGSMPIDFHQKTKDIYIEEIRVEEDRGRLTRAGGKKAAVDWTYAGCPTMRIRTGCGFELGEEAEIFLEELYTLLTYLKLVSPGAGEASIRSNAYVALAEYPALPDQYVKLRNLNSFNFVRKAINSELSREEDLMSSGGVLQAESRLWNEELSCTESFHQYREQKDRFEAVSPAVTVPLLHAPADSSREDKGLELPAARRARLMQDYGLSRLRSVFICREKDRADYFEEAVRAGAEPLLAARWMAGELMKALHKDSLSIKQCKLESADYARIISLLSSRRINSFIAKKLIAQICHEGGDLDALLQEPGMSMLSDRAELQPIIDRVLAAKPKSVASLRRGEMPPLEYLTGLVMKESGGRADAARVKEIIKESLGISVIYVLTMGGSISAEKLADGTVAAGDCALVESLLADEGETPVRVVKVRSMLSEETEPSDWAVLIGEIAEHLQSGLASGIVVTHGTDTLPYTAALLYWLFSASKVPIVLTASSAIPSESSEAKESLALAVRTAREEKGGVFVAYKGRLLSPLNLKYTGGSDDSFSVWNPAGGQGAGGVISESFLSVPLPDKDMMASLLNDAA
ncbi:MAG: asparaginase, partial [Treponema sp.]|nr:asparaginase [Treponema sp.]